MRTQLVILAALLLAVPVAAANWNYRGNNEPDTAYDTAAWMWQDADTSTDGHKIYFNGFARVARETHYNPNVAALGSRVQPPVTAMSMVLGFWKDCNGDGYIGNVEQTFLEYPAQLLLDAGVCPATTPGHNQPYLNYLYPHNDGTWVRELIWIGPRVGGIGAWSQNPTNFYADGTGVWADWGLPGDEPVVVCPSTGNLGIRSTGALLDGLDCTTYYRGTRSLNEAEGSTGLPVGGWDSHDVDNSDATLNVDNPAYPFLYGPEEGDGHPEEGDYRGYNGGLLARDRDSTDRRERVVTVVDCDAEGGGVSTNPDPRVPSDPLDPATYPSAYETANDTFEVVTQGDTFLGQTDQTENNDPCAPNSPSDEGAAYPSVEGYTEATFPDAGRVEVDFPAEFSVGSRNVLGGQGAQCQAFTSGPNAGKMAYTRHPVLGYCPPVDGGLAVERDDLVVGPAWRTNAQVNTYATTTREGLKTDGEQNLGAFYFTFYAKVGDAALAIGSSPNSGLSKYGQEACGAFTTGIHGGWNCDPNAWVARCNDPELPTLPGQCYRVGFTYNLRDIDCWDGTLARGVGVHAGAADVSTNGPCEGNAGNEQIDTTIV